MEVKNSIAGIPVQDPSEAIFSATDLTWTKFGSSEHQVDDVALIPFSRVDHFIAGESSNVECPTQFHIERGRKRQRGSLKACKSDDYLIYRLYWCSFGPENYGEGGTILPSRRYRLNTRNRAARPQSMRGCTCHFAIKRLYARPSVAMIIYHERRHVNKSGFICHGPLDKDAIGPGANKIPYVGTELQQQTMAMIYLGIPAENIVQTHIEGVQRYCGTNACVNASRYVEKLEMIIKRSTHELDLDDQASVRMWADKNKKAVFFYQDSSDSEPFILGIQTEWQLQQMVRFGHQGLLACDSSFGVSKLKYPLYTLLAFDSRQHALPVAWIITRTMANSDVSKWMKVLIDRVHSSDPGWKIIGFIIDDAALDVDPIREIFGCPVLFGLWRIRRSWQRNVARRCKNHEVRREMFKRLGNILHCIWSGEDHVSALGEFLEDFIDQREFMAYFKENWVPKLEMWLASMSDLPLASSEASGAVETYRLKLKSKLYDDNSHLGALQRVDFLIHKLTTEIHSSHWLDHFADESGTFDQVKHEYISSTSWNRAHQIPDTSVTFHNRNDAIFAKVKSQTDPSQEHVVWNPGSEFALCDCLWALSGNLCKHSIKANLLFLKGKEEEETRVSSMCDCSFKRVLEELWRRPAEDSVGLDLAVAWAGQVLDRVGVLVELCNAGSVGSVVDNLPLKWVTKKGRTSVGKPGFPLKWVTRKGRTSAEKAAPSSVLALPGGKESKRESVPLKRSRKRKRLSLLWG